MEDLGKQIKNIRDSYNLSQDRFAKRLGLSGKTISAYETNRITPPLKVLEKISDVYKVTIYDLPEEYVNEINKRIENLYKNISDLKSSIYKGLTF